jgi:SAM-dependent methyltransferase
LTRQGARVAATDLSIGMLGRGAELQGSVGSPALLQVDARRLPFADASFDLACSAYGAVPFVADPERIMAEVARVLRPGGRWVFSVTHPVRWAFPDDPGEGGLTATRSYFDRTPYVEEAEDGTVIYAEHHRTLGDRIRDIVGAGLVLEDLVEPMWPDTHRRVWGGWSPLRGERIPGTAIFLTRKPA